MVERGPVAIEPVSIEDIADTRSHSRRAVEGVLLETPIRGQIIDLSEGGLGVESGRPLEVNRQYVFRLKTKHGRPEFRGEVRWCRLKSIGAGNGSTAPIYRSGIALVER
jgi:hypothetical protein